MISYINRIIEEHKWYLSEQAGYDIGTPTTIDFLLAIRNTPQQEKFIRFQSQLKENLPTQMTREDLVSYHFATDQTRIKPELTRFTQITTGQDKISPESIDEYVKKNNLSNLFNERIKQSLGF